MEQKRILKYECMNKSHLILSKKAKKTYIRKNVASLINSARETRCPHIEE